jgi:hypothetical protein
VSGEGRQRSTHTSGATKPVLAAFFAVLIGVTVAVALVASSDGDHPATSTAPASPLIAPARTAPPRSPNGTIPGAPRAPALRSAATAAAGQLRVVLDAHADWNLPATARRHDIFVIQPWWTHMKDRIKAIRPSAQVLVHKNLSGCSYHDNRGFYSTGVSCDQADKHPGWYLRDSTGRKITFMDYPWLYAMDVGKPSYQRAWAHNVVNELVRNGYDGAWMDNTDTTMKYDFANYPARYPTDGDWRAATRSALAYIGPRLTAAGKLSIPNIGAWGGFPSVGNSYLQNVSGGADQKFVKWGYRAGIGYASEEHWQSQLNNLKYTQSQGKYFLANTESSTDDEAAAVYGWATVLLGANGRAAFTLRHHSADTWFPEYGYKIGRPTGPESVNSDGVHRRVFTKGIVVVNPTSGQYSASLHGTYSGTGLTRVHRVTLAPHSAYVLIGTTNSARGD